MNEMGGEDLLLGKQLNQLLPRIENNFPSKVDLCRDPRERTIIRKNNRIHEKPKEEIHKRQELSPPVSESQVVLQSTYSIAGKETKKRYLETTGAGPCVVATLYDPIKKLGSMVHFDNRSNIPRTIREMIDKMGGDSSKMQMRIIGGYEEEKSSQGIVEQLRTIARLDNTIIVEEDVLQNSKERESVDVVMDTETGEVFDLPSNHSERFSLTQMDKIKARMEMILEDPLTKIGKVRFIENFLDE